MWTPTSPSVSKAFIVVAACLTVSNSSASECPVERPDSLRRWSMEEMFSTGLVSYHMVVDNSQFLYVGEITETRGGWSPDSSFALNHHTLRVEEILKGEDRDTVVLTTLAGTTGDVTASSSDEPHGGSMVGTRAIFRFVQWDVDVGDYSKGQYVFASFPTTMPATSELIQHIRYVVAGNDVRPVCFGESDFVQPTLIEPSSWGRLKGRR